MGNGLEREIEKTLDKVWLEWPWEKALPREQLFKHAAHAIAEKLREEPREVHHHHCSRCCCPLRPCNNEQCNCNRGSNFHGLWTGGWVCPIHGQQF